MERTIKFTIGKDNFTADFPNCGALIDLESLKQALSGNKYGVMAQSGIESAYRALDLIDAIAFYQICCPKISKFFDIKNYSSMQLDEIQELVKTYKEQIWPWLNKNFQEIKEIS